MDPQQLPLHVFLSYSRQDEAVVHGVRQALEAAIALWIDTKSLVPGTPDWEAAIRTAIRSAHCIILLCSPAARQSAYVQAELALAQHYKIPIIPAWVDGKSWIDSAPLSLSQAQFVDLRGEQNNTGLGILKRRIASMIGDRMPKHAVIDDCFAGWYDHSLQYYANGFQSYVSIILDNRPSSRTPPERQRKEQMAVFDPAAYSTIQGMLDDLFMAYLSGRVEPLSYGKDWLLRGYSRKKRYGINPDRIIAPWSYLEFGWSRPRSWKNSALRFVGAAWHSSSQQKY